MSSFKRTRPTKLLPFIGLRNAPTPRKRVQNGRVVHEMRHQSKEWFGTTKFKYNLKHKQDTSMQATNLLEVHLLLISFWHILDICYNHYTLG